MDRKFIVLALYLLGAVITAIAWMVKLLEENSELGDAIPEALERGVLWPVFLIGSLIS